jgi:hypothetical protein
MAVKKKTTTDDSAITESSVLAGDKDFDFKELGGAVPMIKGEPAKAYRALLDFCVSGYSLQELRTGYANAVVGGKSVPTVERKVLNNWHDEYQWPKRRLEYDLVRAAKLERSFAEVNNRSKALLADARIKALQRVNQMLDYPIEYQEVEAELLITPEMVGTRIATRTVIKPAVWTMGTVPTLINAVVAAEASDRKDPRVMIQELKRLGYTVIATDGSVMATAADILDASN